MDLQLRHALEKLVCVDTDGRKAHTQMVRVCVQRYVYPLWAICPVFQQNQNATDGMPHTSRVHDAVIRQHGNTGHFSLNEA